MMMVASATVCSLLSSRRTGILAIGQTARKAALDVVVRQIDDHRLERVSFS